MKEGHSDMRETMDYLRILLACFGANLFSETEAVACLAEKGISCTEDTIHRVLGELLRFGLGERPGDDGRYRLTGQCPVFSTEQPSAEFIAMMCSVHSHRAACHCGRIHFDESTPAAYDDGELQGLQEQASRHPEKYVVRSTRVFWGTTLDGQQVVGDCPCGYPRIIEEGIWTRRYGILEYLEARASREPGRRSTDFTQAVAATATALKAAEDK